MKLIFFFKVFKILCRFWDIKKIPDNAFDILDNCIWTCCGKISQLSWQYIGSSVKVLKDSPKAWDLTKRDVFVLGLSEINGKVGQKHHHADFRSAMETLTRRLQKGTFKQELSCIEETTFLGVNNFRKI